MNIVLNSISEMMSQMDSYMELFLSNMGLWGALISCFLITIESILPILPVCVFITLVFYSFGNFFGFIISWIFTCLGCLLSFSLFRSKIKGWFEKRILQKKERKKLQKFMDYVNQISLSGLVVLIAIPFTPASVVNIAAGLSNMSKKKFIVAIALGKIFMVYFWGYIGTTLIECFTHPLYLVRIFILLLIAFLASKVLNKHFHLD